MTRQALTFLRDIMSLVNNFVFIFFASHDEGSKMMLLEVPDRDLCACEDAGFDHVVPS